jgi:hypothetical protein
MNKKYYFIEQNCLVSYEQKRINYSTSFKAKMAIAAICYEKTLRQLSSQFHVHPNQMSSGTLTFSE